jgi:hypothetical protein
MFTLPSLLRVDAALYDFIIYPSHLLILGLTSRTIQRLKASIHAYSVQPENNSRAPVSQLTRGRTTCVYQGIYWWNET